VVPHAVRLRASSKQRRICARGEEGGALRFMRALADAFLALLGGATFVEASAAGNFVALEEVANASIATTFFWAPRVNV